eukprot:TRINITY_DN6635_c0_g2_i1.p1 TRINITY_DN6635_c0_g2~~TRINITY_DN6635_c0_g2_i1.p1  ORF type:complete len:519 (-),score=105.10 TRINITY_DN6635_c0_g2_i1:287-1843(-)
MERYGGATSSSYSPAPTYSARAAAGGAGPTGYSRRCPPGDSKTTDRRRLLTDRGAYIAFLEAQAERNSEAAMEVDRLGAGLCEATAGLRQVLARVERLEGKGQLPEDLEDALGSALRSAELAQERVRLAEEGARSSRQEFQDELRGIDHRLKAVDLALAEARSSAEAQTARTRNELLLAVQDMGQRMEERLAKLKAFADEGATSIIREAQGTCVRLADDALEASEATQRKLEDYQRRTEASLEVLRVDFTALRAELAGAGAGTPGASGGFGSPRILGYPEATATGSGPAAAEGLLNGAFHSPLSAPPVQSGPAAAGGLGALDSEAASSLADAIERRLASRLGQQVLQLSEVLRRVVQAQATLHTQVSGPGVALATPSVVKTAAFENGGRPRRQGRSRSSSPPSRLGRSTPPRGVSPHLQSTASFPGGAYMPYLPAEPVARGPVADVGDGVRSSAEMSTGSAPWIGPPARSTQPPVGAPSEAGGGDWRRRAAIDDLYKELRLLERDQKALPGAGARRRA